jgi:hypothetical protein
MAMAAELIGRMAYHRIFSYPPARKPVTSHASVLIHWR